MHTKKAVTGAKRKKEAERNRARTLPARTRVKGKIREAVAELESGGAEAKQAVLAAAKEIDKAASKGALHRRTAARKKSRLMKRLAGSASGAEQAG